MAYTNCLTDYIGLQGCSTSVPPSGVYVNSLPGISLKAVDATADEEQVTWAGVWTDVQERATRRFFTKVRAELAKKYKLNGLLQSFDLTQNLGSLTTANAAKLRGFTIELDNFVSEQHFVVSNFQQVNFQVLKLYLPSAINTTLYIYDLITGTRLKTMSLTGVQGWNTIQVNEKYTARKFFVCYDATNITGTQLEVLNEYCSCEAECEASIYGAESNIATSVQFADLTRATNTFGLSGIFTIECAYDALICNNKEVFINPLWYLLGSELLTERIYTTRVNRYTTIDAAKAEKLRGEFETLFEEELETAVSGINLNLCDCCIECNADVIIKENFG